MDIWLTRFFEDVSNSMVSAQDFDARWTIINKTLVRFGATAVNATAIEPVIARPRWFRSTLGEHVLSSYVRDGHFQNDVLIKHAARRVSPVVWRTEEGWCGEMDDGVASFTEFVTDSGYRSIVSHSRNGSTPDDVRCLTFCSTYHPKEVFADQNLKKIQLATSILLPWIGRPAHQNSSEYVRTKKATLSRREAEALSFLASGKLYTRIADIMGISEAMVAKHIFSARQKLGARTREQAVALAIRDNLIAL